MGAREGGKGITIPFAGAGGTLKEKGWTKRKKKTLSRKPGGKDKRWKSHT